MPSSVLSRPLPFAASRTRGYRLSGLAIGVICLSVVLTVSRAHMAVPVLSALKLPLILNAIGLLSVMQRFRPLQRAVSRSWIWRSLLTILCFAVVGIPFSIYPGRSLDFLTEAYIKAIIIGLLAFAVAITSGGVRSLAKALLAGGVIAAVLALVWARKDGDGRLSGAFTYDANDLALISCVTVPLCVWYFFDEKGLRRWLALVATGLLLFVVMKTGSRGGFLGLATVAAFFLLAGATLQARRTTRLALGILICAAVAVPLAPAEYRARLMSIGASEEDYNFTSYSGRIEVWKRGLSYVAQRPVFGVGLNNFRTAEGKLSDVARERARDGRGMKWSAAHNSYLQVLVEIGVISGVLFFGLAMAVPLTLLRTARSSQIEIASETDFLAVCVGASLVAFAVCGFFLSFAYYDIVYILQGLAAAILAGRASQRVSRSVTNSHGMPRPQRRPSYAN